METKFQCLVRRITYGSPVLTVLANGRDARRVMKARYPSPPERPVVISVNPYSGLCDRLRGMCGVYQICKELGLEYKIAHFVPFALYDYLEPNKVDWRIEEKDIEWDTRLVKIMSWHGAALLRPWPTSHNDTHNFHFRQFKKVLAKVKNKNQVHVYNNLECVKYEDINGLFHELFKPTEELQKLVDWNKEQIGGAYISITTRFQNLIGDFYEGKSFGELATEEEKQDYISRCIKKIEEIHNQHPDKNVLVTSDSVRFLDVAKQLPYVHVNPGKRCHLSHVKDAGHMVYLNSFVDLLTIADATKTYQLVTGRMYKGFFTKTAAAINSRPYELVQF